VWAKGLAIFFTCRQTSDDHIANLLDLDEGEYISCGQTYLSSCRGLQVWGEAYREKHNALVLNGTYRLLTIDHQIPMEGHFGPSPTEPLINWPSAAKHPLFIFFFVSSLCELTFRDRFYVTIYAAIGLTAAFVNVVATVVEIAGGLRASKRLSKSVIVFVHHIFC
jgi:hypothetical protein